MDFVNETEIGFSRKIKEVKFGNWTFSPKHQTLTDGTILRELEPLLFSILTYFIQNNDRIISRQELVDEVWKQAYVDDNAINRAMSELRKVLKSEKQRAQVIKTHYRKGYSFLLDVEVLYHQAKPQVTLNVEVPASAKKGAKPKLEKVLPAESENRIKPSFIKLGAILFAIIIFIFILVKFNYLATHGDSIEESLDVSSTLLSWKKGTSFTPNLNKSGKYLAYAFSESKSDSIDLFIKDMTTLKEYKVAESEAQLYPVGWSKQDDLYYQLVLTGENAKCEIWRVSFQTDIVGAPHEKLFDCKSDEILSAEIIDEGQTLLYTKYNYRGRPDLSAIVSRDLITGSEFQVTSPKISDFGDYYVKASNKGDKVVFFRALTHGTKIFVANTDGSDLEEIVELDYRIYSVSWSESDKSISWINSGMGLLNTFSFETSMVATQNMNSEFDFSNAFGLQIINNHRAILATKYLDLDIATLNTNEDIPKLTEYASTDMEEKSIAAFNHKEASLFLVGKSKPSLWFYSGERRQKVLDFDFSDVKSIAISPDDQHFMVARTTSISIFRADNFQRVREINLNGAIKSASWPLGGKILLTYEDAAAINCWFYNLDNDQLIQITNHHIKSASMVDDEHILIIDDKQQVYRQNINSGESQLVISLAEAGEIIWTADKSYFYFTTDAKVINKKSLFDDTQVEQLIELKNEMAIRLSISPKANGAILFLNVMQFKDNLLLDLAFDKALREESL